MTRPHRTRRSRARSPAPMSAAASRACWPRRPRRTGPVSVLTAGPWGCAPLRSMQVGSVTRRAEPSPSRFPAPIGDVGAHRAGDLPPRRTALCAAADPPHRARRPGARNAAARGSPCGPRFPPGQPGRRRERGLRPVERDHRQRRARSSPETPDEYRHDDGGPRMSCLPAAANSGQTRLTGGVDIQLAPIDQHHYGQAALPRSRPPPRPAAQQLGSTPNRASSQWRREYPPAPLPDTAGS